MRGLALLVALLALAIPVGSAGSLDIYFIDTEGGQATLLVTPRGQSVLIDAGYGPRGGRGRGPVQPADRDANRILAAATEAGVKRIDVLVVTHFHPDHAGGVAELVKKLPVDTFVDYGAPLGTPYGPDRMSVNTFTNYEMARKTGRHLEARAGDRLPLDGLEATIVSAGGTHIPRALTGGGETNSACTGLEAHPEDGTENFRSVGVLFRFGAFRFLDLGDMSGMTLTRLACPRNLIGPVSVLLTPHHGDYDTNVPSLYAAVRPRVVVMNNGVTRGGSPDHFETIHTLPSLEDLWQLHLSQNAGARNADEVLLANTDDGRTTGYFLKLSAFDDGSFTVRNQRNGFEKTYPRRPSPRIPVASTPSTR
jgi:beta-lactamase superfamily II metal-dependent hydrolase